MSVIVLLTDFGTDDPYVGVMKGVMAGILPTAQMIDLSHAIAPQNVRQGAYLLRTAYRYFPRGSVFLGVVDPGVGTSRRPIALETARGFFVGPDNGLFSAVIEDSFKAVLLRTESGAANLSHVFHGRDIFAGAAAALASGAPLAALGTAIEDVTRIDVTPVQEMEDGSFQGEVLHIDHFGNVITSFGGFQWTGNTFNIGGAQNLDPKAVVLAINGAQLNGLQHTYGEVPHGQLLALINSDNHLEIATNQGSAASRLAVSLGDPVYLSLGG
jgi:S-adenosyl-L-methionine hydrolase (adenosine-forming)